MVYIVRHGQTDWNLEGRYQGHIDVELNQQGVDQAQNIASQLKGKKFDKVFSSPLKRAYATAEIISDIPVTVDERLIERSNGQLEGKLKSECLGLVNFNDPDESQYNIETITLFRRRIFEFFDFLQKEYIGKDVLVVTHAGVSIYAKCYFDGEPLDKNYASYKLKNCEVAVYG